MAAKLTVSRKGYPPLMRGVNAVLSAAARAHLIRGRVTVDQVLDDARKSTGLTDWGDEAFLEGMHKVMNDPGVEDFTPLAWLIVRGTWVKAVTQRLKLQALLKAHPEIHDIEVKRPVFVLGFPRTGTSAIQELLALDPNRRGLPFWELFSPLPRAENHKLDRWMSEQYARATLVPSYLIAPEMTKLHAIRYDTFEECWYLFCNTFTVLNWDIMTGLHAYGQWLLNLDMRFAYQEYKTWLKVMLWRRPAQQLLLKCPEHLWFVDALLDTFPDAAIVWTHRDPIASVASYSSMMTLTRRLLYGTFEPDAMGPFVTKRFHEGVSRAMAARDAWGREANFFDANFDRTVKDPISVVEDACAHFDLPLRADFRERASAGRLGERSDKAGEHLYSAEAFGVDRDEVLRLFGPYVERFQIKTGAKRS